MCKRNSGGEGKKEGEATCDQARIWVSAGAKKARSNLPKLPNTTFIVVICWVSNSKDMVLALKQLQFSYTDVRHWKELIDFIDKNGGPKKPYILTLMIKCTLEQDELEEEYMGLYTNRQKTLDPLYGKISYNCCLSNAFKLNLRHDPNIFSVEMKRATGEGIAKHMTRPARVIPASHVYARCAQLLFIIHRLWKVPKRVDERRERRTVGKRMILELR